MPQALNDKNKIQAIRRGPLRGFIRLVEESLSSDDDKAGMIEFLSSLSAALTSERVSEELSRVAAESASEFDVLHVYSKPDEREARLMASIRLYMSRVSARGLLHERLEAATVMEQEVAVNVTAYDQLVGISMLLRGVEGDVDALYLVALEIRRCGEGFCIRMFPLAAALVSERAAGSYVNVSEIGRVPRRWRQRLRRMHEAQEEVRVQVTLPRELFEWLERLARASDESVDKVLKCILTYQYALYHRLVKMPLKLKLLELGQGEAERLEELLRDILY
jgi:hypothetical protein